MSDHLVRVLVEDADLRGSAVVATATCREAVRRHGCAPTAGVVLSEALTAGLLIARLHKTPRRVNLQIECDGPLRGLVVDADADGTVRGFVRSPAVNFPSANGPRIAPAFGGRGLVNVLREMNPGEWYRGSVELPARSVARGVEAYLADSEQVDSALEVAVVLDAPGVPTVVAGVLFQRLPEGSKAALAAVRARLDEGWLGEYLAANPEPAAGALLDALMGIHGGDNLQLLERLDVRFRCGCDHDRVLAALLTLGASTLDEMIAEGDLPAVTCEFCGEVYQVTEAELSRVRDALGR